MLLYYTLYSWFHGNKYKIAPLTFKSTVLQEKDIVACSLRIVEEFTLVVKKAAHSSGIVLKSVKIDFSEIHRDIAAKITSGNYDTIPELLDSYIEKVCLQSLSQKQVDNFKTVYNAEKNLILSNELYKPEPQSGSSKIQTSVQVSTYVQNVIIEKGIKKKGKEMSGSIL